MTTYPSASDPVAAFTRADGTTAGHSADHGRVIDIWENVKHHGATGNGTTDDSTAIQAAINAAAGTVYFPAGTYKIGTTLTVPTDVTLRGTMGATASVLKYSTGGSSSLISMTDVDNVTLRDLYILGDTGTGDVISIGGTQCNNVKLMDLYFDAAAGTSTTAWLVNANNCLPLIMDRCSSRTIYSGAVYLRGNSNTSCIKECAFNGAGGAHTTADKAIQIDYPSEQVRVVDTIVESFRGSYGLYINGSNDCLVSSCWFEDNAGSSLTVAAVDAVSILSNRFQTGTGATHSAIDFTGVNYAAFVGGNDIRDAVTLSTDPAATNHCAYVFLGNEWLTGGSLTDNTNASRDTFVEIASRDANGGTRGLVVHKGPLTHAGATLGFFGATPASRTSAYTQTYSTASRTNPNATSANLSTTASTQTTPWGFATQAQADAIATQVNATQADVLALAKLLNSVIDDLQTYGLFQ